jgi:hypothetical protein
MPSPLRDGGVYHPDPSGIGVTGASTFINGSRNINRVSIGYALGAGAIGLRPLVSAGFQVLLTRLIAVLFIVQSPYLSTIGHRGVFSLGRWSAPLRTEFHELRATLESTC